MIKFTHTKSFQSFQANTTNPFETNQLICIADALFDVYKMRTLASNGEILFRVFDKS